ncbi:nicotinamide n-methyltransferase [Orbilia ellipsospora]|uniref:Protein N-terminal and lysine N-methyltransferase EFM7 n=1 Tax=Orbilia ellipsospora TaxID=2528407 RepID=A0AAV9WTZ0_9PEZI
MSDLREVVDTEDDAIDVGMFEEPEDYRPPTPPPTFATHNLLDTSKSITVRLVGKNPLWGHLLWNASRVCANYIESHASELVRSKTVLEFGAGAGLPGLLCAGLGASIVVLSDYPDPDLLSNLEYNKTHSISTSDESQDGQTETHEKLVLDNGARVECAGYIWGHNAQNLLTICPQGFDLLILSDLIFNHSQHEALLKSVQSTLAKPDGVALVFFTPHRPWLYEADLNFFKIARESGDFDVEQVLEQKMDKAMFEVDKGDENVRRMVYGYRITWKKV